MSLFSGDALWPNINASHFSPMAMCIWDTSANAFRPLTNGELNFQNTGTTFTSSSVTILGTPNVTISGNITGTVNTKPSNTFSAPSNFEVSGSGKMGTALAENANRKALFIQNIGMNPLFIKFGQVGATDHSLSMILAGGTLSGDGKGGSFLDEGCQITGLVAVSGIQPNYIIWDA